MLQPRATPESTGRVEQVRRVMPISILAIERVRSGVPEPATINVRHTTGVLRAVLASCVS